MPKRKFNIKAIILDMDGVITNTMPDHFIAWRKILLDMGIKVSRTDIYKREGQKGIDSVLEIFAEHKKHVSRESAPEILTRKEILFKKISRKRYIPGTILWIQNLKKQGFKVALVTGTSRNEAKQILPREVSDALSVMITANDVHNGKPHPEPYLKCLKLLNVKAKHAVVVENAPFGIRSAKQAGIRCLALETSLPKEYLREADHIFPSIDSMRRKVLFELNHE